MVKPQGRRGEVSAELHTDFPERFAERTRVFALRPDGSRSELQIEDFWPHKGRVVLKFQGLDSIEDADSLRGCEIQIPLEERAPLEAGSVYVGDLVGCKVFDGGGELGTVKDVQFGAGEAPLLVIDAGNGRELLVPLAQEFLTAMDTAAKRIEMKLPEGMLELDAPLSSDEKRRQRQAE